MDPLETSNKTARLLENIHRGDSDALQELVARFYPFIRKVVALHLGTRPSAWSEPEHVVQEAISKAIRDLPRFESRSEGSFRAWVATLTRRTVIDHVRKSTTQKNDRAREQRLDDGTQALLTASGLVGPEATPSQHAQAHELEERLTQAMLKLGDRDRAIILILRVCGGTYEDAVELLDISSTAVARGYLTRALSRLADHLGEV